MSHANFGGKKEFIFTWRIENYSYCWHERGDKLISPVFFVDTLQGTRWTLSLFPRGDTESSPNHISFYLNRSPDCDGPEDLRGIYYELSLLASDGSVLKSSEFLRAYVSFKKGKEIGHSEFLERNLLLEKKNAYLPQDTLTVCCVFVEYAESVFRIGQFSARTRIGIERFSFVQVVERFSSLQLNEEATAHLKCNSEELASTAISICKTEGLHSDERIMVEIRKISKQVKRFSCILYLLDAKGNATQSGLSEARCDANGENTWKCPLNFSKNALLDKRGEYLPEDSLSLRFAFTFTVGLEINKIDKIDCVIPQVSTRAPKLGSCRNLNIQSSERERADCPSALDDFRSLYEDQTFSDVKLKTKTEIFLANKFVLCARSPVFKAIFMSDMKEKASDCISVDDLEDDTVRRLLLFLYSDTVDDMQWDIAEKLYYAADKYQVQRLKGMCSSFLMDNLSVSNAIDALVLADRHQDLKLKTVVEEFILVSDEKIFSSEAWETFMKINPLLAVETMQLKYKKK